MFTASKSAIIVQKVRKTHGKTIKGNICATVCIFSIFRCLYSKLLYMEKKCVHPGDGKLTLSVRRAFRSLPVWNPCILRKLPVCIDWCVVLCTLSSTNEIQRAMV